MIAYFYTLNKDVVSLGIALGVKNLKSLIDLEKDLKSSLGKIKKSSKADESEIARGKQAMLQGGTATDIHLLERGERHDKFEVRKEIVARMRQQLGDVVIRRTAASRNKDGNLISGIEPYKMCVFDIDMRPKEKEEFEEIVANVEETM